MKVIVEGPCSSPAAVSRAMSAARHSVFCEPLVIAASRGRGASSRSTSRTSSALSPDWLTHTTSVSRRSIGSRKCSSSAVSSIEQATPRAASAVAIG